MQAVLLYSSIRQQSQAKCYHIQYRGRFQAVLPPKSAVLLAVHCTIFLSVYMKYRQFSTHGFICLGLVAERLTPVSSHQAQ